jgi:penicillin-binding protein 1A
MKIYLRIPAAILAGLATLVVSTAALFAGGYYYVAPGLPDAEQLRDVRMQVPLSVYSRDGRLIAQFGEVMRTPAAYRDIPQQMIQAVLAAEDERFFEHAGVDYRGITRAALNVLRTLGDRSIGGSTITQQVAREYFLTRERLYIRKFKEAILALRIEQEFSKEEILELYLNTTFFGQRSYGVVTAARTYFGKDLDELTIAETALIAGIAQGPSIQNPVTSPERAGIRRAYVLRRMRELGMISADEHDAALAEPIVSQRFGRRTELDAPYVAEMVRVEMIQRYGSAAETAGYKVTTTLDSRLQRAATNAVRQGLLDYDERHGYRGALANVELPEWVAAAQLETLAQLAEWRAELDALLTDYPNRVGLETAIVLAVEESGAQAYFPGRGLAEIPFEAVSWAARYIDDSRVSSRPGTVGEVLTAGDIVRFRVADNGSFRLGQIPDVQGALVAIDPQDGGVTALVGGFDFFLSNYNRATQARRQPGSAFKPFVYSAALEHGFTAATIVNDAPLSESNPEMETVWRPVNYSGRFYGPTRFREALVRSLNASSVRIARDAGVNNVVRHLRGFGFDDVALPPNLAISLGAGGVAPLDLAAGYATFANGGYRVEPYFIDRIEDASGQTLYTAGPRFVCPDCGTQEQDADPKLSEEDFEFYPAPRLAQRAISVQNAFLITDILQDVIRRGTGQRALQLGRRDLAGKTGTSNDFTDAWFGGYNGDLVATVWVGFDDFSRSLGVAGGAREEGGRTALPMWNLFMGEALAGAPERPPEVPPGIIERRINPSSGLIASDSATGTMVERFELGRTPDREAEPAFAPRWSTTPGQDTPRSAAEPIF